MGQVPLRFKMTYCGFVFAVVVSCLTTPGVFAATGDPAAVFNGVSLSVASPTVPPGGLLQMQVFVTEPNPILKGKQRMVMAPVRLAAAAPVVAATSPLGPI